MTIIIGGGAAGYAAAITAARQGEQVTVLERGRKPLKKLAATGNGRGNLLNCGQPQYYGDEAFALDVLGHMPYEQIAAFLESLGVSLVEEDEGRMYPSSYLAASAVDAMRLAAQKLGVKLETNVRATRMEKGFTVEGVRTVFAPDVKLKSGRVKPGEAVGEEKVRFAGDRVIVAAGGAAAPLFGTDGSAYALLTDFGHGLVAPRPALCAILCGKAPIEGLSGQRVRATLTLDGIHQSRGEALFADDGVSGIAAMQLSRFARPGSALVLDLRESVMGSDQHMDVENWLRSRPSQRMDELLVGAASPALASALIRQSQGDVAKLAGLIRHFPLTVTGVRGFDSAQVTAGGVETAQFDPATMQSRLCPGLYAAGEVLDVDGACGGFNLMFAFATGILAGRGASEICCRKE